MDKQKLGLVALVVIALLLAIGFQSKLQASHPTPPLAELLLHEDDLPEGAVFFRGEERGMIEEIAEFVGLSLQRPGFVEGEMAYFAGGYPDEGPKAIAHGLYRYQAAEQAMAQFERLRQEVRLTPLGRSTPIVRQSERSFAKVEGQILEASDPIGTAYWFVGVYEDIVITLVTLGPDDSGQRQLLETVLPKLIERISGVQ